MKKIAILGSTGSIGRQAIDVVEANPDRFEVVGLAARRDVRKLAEQVRALKPELVALTDTGRLAQLRERLGGRHDGDASPGTPEILHGSSAVESVATLESADVVLNAMVGAVGLRSTVAALKAGKTLALANKESLVVGGELVTSLTTRDHQLLPVDSEHSALFQCLQGEDPAAIRRLIITGSGGPFRGQTRAQLATVTPAQALNHPTWRMGPKITIDSATLMNKGLEVIEAHFLFGVPYDRIEVLIHPQSIIHSLVEFVDGSVKAQLGYPDMRLPIQYALSYPERLPMESDPLALQDVTTLSFEEPDLETFACLRYALEAAEEGKTYPVVLNAANEVAVEAFLEDRIPFTGIAEVIGGVLSKHEAETPDDLETILHVDRRARFEAEVEIERIGERQSIG